jgi:hypothetical protein
LEVPLVNYGVDDCETSDEEVSEGLIAAPTSRATPTTRPAYVCRYTDVAIFNATLTFDH